MKINMYTVTSKGKCIKHHWHKDYLVNMQNVLEEMKNQTEVSP